ncbi:epididymal protein 13 isoform X3 [Lemur catta]|uniref:epididymal protein 13 isoform X3 n=1 Tax=Lemur catta TaxID=9447 RepID=UPI001E2697E3|nr:epididymal protein 13 isoform X3 [Lemur catta]
MRRSEPFLKMSLWMLLFLGLAEACTPQEVATEEKISLLKGIVGAMSRLSPDDKTEEEILKRLLSLQVLNEETSGCKEEVKPTLATGPSKKMLPKRKNGWNFLKCAYMVMTFLFVSYNKGDWGPSAGTKALFGCHTRRK